MFINRRDFHTLNLQSNFEWGFCQFESHHHEHLTQCENHKTMIKFEHCCSSLQVTTFLANICTLFYHWWDVLSMFPSMHHSCQKQSHEKKWWWSLDYWNCRWDLNHAQDISAKKMKTSQHNSSYLSWKLLDYTWNKRNAIYKL